LPELPSEQPDIVRLLVPANARDHEGRLQLDLVEAARKLKHHSFVIDGEAMGPTLI
jgi:hypothetical protein